MLRVTAKSKTLYEPTAIGVNAVYCVCTWVMEHCFRIWHSCQHGLKKMRDFLLFIDEFPLTFTTSTCLDILKNLN